MQLSGRSASAEAALASLATAAAAASVVSPAKKKKSRGKTKQPPPRALTEAERDEARKNSIVVSSDSESDEVCGACVCALAFLPASAGDGARYQEEEEEA